jgi:hypothetical protein
MPNRSQEVDRFISGLDHPLKEEVERLRTAILDPLQENSTRTTQQVNLLGNQQSKWAKLAQSAPRPTRPSPLPWPSRRGNNACCSIPERRQPLGA